VVHVRDLTESERGVLFALLAHLAEADLHIDPSEVLALDDLAEELGITDLRERLMRARASTRTRAALLAAVATVTRPDARAIIRTRLVGLAQADGDRQAEESDLLEQVSAVWSTP
jgi:uncharacterized tellurite resistance protein B-like protein